MYNSIVNIYLAFGEKLKTNLCLDKNKILFLIISLFGSVLFFILFSKYFGPIISCCSFVFYLIIHYFILKYRKKLVINFFTLLQSSFCSIACSVIVSKILSIYDSVILEMYRLLIIPFLSLSLMYIWILFSSIIFSKIKKHEICKWNIIQYFLSYFLMLYLFYIFLPFDTLLRNYKEYTFPCYEFVVANAFYISFLVLFSVVFLLLPKKVFVFATNTLTGLLLSIYIQFSFMNKYVGQINGAEFNWKNHPVFSIFTLLIYLFVLFLPFLINKLLKSVSKELLVVFPAIIAIITLSALMIDFIKVPKIANQYRQYYYSGEKQYKLSPNGNVVIFVIDAVDNSLLKEIYNNEPEIYDGFSDFTFYTNTCSVFDLTIYSHAQFMSGYYTLGDKKDSGNFVDIVYPRLNENGYILNGYNLSSEECRALDKYIDNFYGRSVSARERFKLYFNYSDYRKELIVFDDLISRNSNKLSMFQVLPTILKGKVDISEIDFTHCVTNTDFVYDCDMYNEDFYNNLSLSLDETDKKYIVFQSIYGTHFPCDNYYEKTKECVGIAQKYIDEMKRIGVYDDSTILIISDHGVHDGIDGIPFPTAATPMFFIKEPNVNHDSIILNDAPVYHEDIMATILYNIGLYYENDCEYVGNTIYDYNEGDLRERVWYDTCFEDDSVRKYTYYGDTSDLEYAVNNNIYENVEE